MEKQTKAQEELSKKLEKYRTQAMEIASDFRYGDEIMRRLETAKTEIEITRIMATAREAR